MTIADGGRIRVVLADDTEDIRALLKASLALDGRFEVVGESGDGFDTITLCGLTQPDVVVLDLGMPNMDGLEAITGIRREAPNTRIVILSGFSAGQMEREATSLGASAYLEKGLDLFKIATTLAQVCGVDGQAVAAPPTIELEAPRTHIARGGSSGKRVLLVDDDPDIAACAQLNLTLAGFEVKVAADGEAGLAAAAGMRPDLVVVDVMMPGMDGYTLCRALRDDPRTAQASIIMLTARATMDDKIAGLAAGADDYVAKPFDPEELVARAHAALRRSDQMREMSPLTGLPGNAQIAHEISKLCADPSSSFAVIHADLDGFKAFNDAYGFARGDEAIRSTADVLSTALIHAGGYPNFLGHIGGDDFVLVCAADSAEVVAKWVIQEFDTYAPSLYDAVDRERGWVERPDRQGVVRRYPIMTISLGIATTASRRLISHGEAAAVASEMKSLAKRHSGSAYEVDRRTADDRAAPH